MLVMRDLNGYNLPMPGYGMAYPASADVESMLWPMRCLRCRKIHDAGKVTPTGRYSDCTVWRCPNCSAEIDDRAGGYGGAERVVIPVTERSDARDE